MSAKGIKSSRILYGKSNAEKKKKSEKKERR